MEHETNIHSHSKDLSAQTVEKKFAFGGERVKTNGQACWGRMGTISKRHGP